MGAGDGRALAVDGAGRDAVMGRIFREHVGAAVVTVELDRVVVVAG
jgi:hypothetical protein